jgi:hypothetical protein
MWISATLAVLLGLCAAGSMPMLENLMQNAPPEQAAEMRRQIAEAESRAQGHSMGEITTQVAIVCVAWGVVMGIVAYFVRGGGRGAALTGTVLTGLSAAYLVLSVIASGAMGGGAGVVQGLCVFMLPLALLILQFRWLFQTAQAAPYVEALRAAGWPTDRPLVMPPSDPPGGSMPPLPTDSPAVPPIGGSTLMPPPPPGISVPPQGMSFPPNFGMLPPPPPGEGTGRFGYAIRPKTSTPATSATPPSTPTASTTPASTPIATPPEAPPPATNHAVGPGGPDSH